MPNAKKTANNKSAETSSVHPHRGLGHTLSLILSMAAAFFLGLVVVSMMLLRGS